MRTRDHRAAAKTIALTCALLALWTATHRYRGLGGDAELYAVQAVARIHANLRHDLFLENTSQDTYTIFSNLYAACISFWVCTKPRWRSPSYSRCGFSWPRGGLPARSRTPARPSLRSRCSSSRRAPMAPIGVFHYAEDWVTARSLAEALVITALACHFRGWRMSGLMIASCALFVHPLMALPGLLLLMCLWSSGRISAIGAARRGAGLARRGARCGAVAVGRSLPRRDGCRLAGGGARAIAVSFSAALVRSGLAVECTALLFIDVELACHRRAAGSQAVYFRDPGRGCGIGGGADRRPDRPHQPVRARAGVAVGVGRCVHRASCFWRRRYSLCGATTNAARSARS